MTHVLFSIGAKKGGVWITHIHTLYTYTQDSAFSGSISFIFSRSFFKRINGLGRRGPRPFPVDQWNLSTAGDTPCFLDA